MIVAAAIRFGPLICVVPAPGRHHNILHAIYELTKGERSDASYVLEKQGFVTDQGVFLDRRQAFLHAVLHDQLKRRTGPGYYNGDELFSEDLW